MHAKLSLSLRTAGLLAGTLLAVTIVRAAESSTDSFPVLDNYVSVSALGVSTSGDGNAFQARNWTSKNGAGGIEDFRYAKDLSKDVSLTSDGHALFGAEDYLGHLSLTKNDFGSVDVGYKRFRTFYDGVGGFFPINGQFYSLTNPDLHVDRSKFWAEVKLAMPDAPVFTLRYTNEVRNGRKDSTIWGDSDNTGITIWSQSALNVVSSTRKFVPAYTDIGEHHQTLEYSMKYTVGRTTFELAAIGDLVDNLDTRYMSRYPGEVKPYPAIPSSPLSQIPYTKANNWTRGYDAQGIRADTFTLLGKFETKLNDAVTLHGGVIHQNTSADLTGDREIDISIPTAFGVKEAIGGFTSGGRPPYSYRAPAGTASATIQAVDLGIDLKPSQDLMVTAAVKAEERKSSANNPVTFINTLVVPATGVTSSVPVSGANYSTINERSWTPEVDVRYTGIRHVSLYATLDYRHAPGSQTGFNTSVSPSGSNQVASTSTSDDSTSESHLNYKIGANWAPSTLVSLRGEVFAKSHHDDFYDVEAGDRFNLGYDFNGLKLTATVHPLPTISCTTRYVLQVGKMDVTDSDGTMNSGDSRSHQIGATVDWTPTKQFYLQGDVNFVFDQIKTSYPTATGAARTVLHNGDNNYWTANALAGCVVDKNTDAQLQYTYYRADNFLPALAATAMPFGAGAEESTVTLGLKHKFSDRLIGSAKIGYFTSKNDTTGGFTNYHARLGYLALTYAL